MKRTVQTVVDFLALPAVAVYALGAWIAGAERVFPGWSQAVSLIPGLCGVYYRRAFYRWTLARCASDACLSFGTVFSHPGASVGDGVYVGLFCSLGDVVLEDNVLLASGVSVINGGKQHGSDRLDVPLREQPGQWPRITIGEDTWIGERAVVMADVGRHCIIGAGAVVTRPVPDYSVAMGVPARVVRSRQKDGV